MIGPLLLCLSKTTKFLSGRALYFFHNSLLRCSFFSRPPLPLCSRSFARLAALQLENLALRHPIGILPRSARKRPKLTPGDRLFWVGLPIIRIVRNPFGLPKALSRAPRGSPS